jgi:hypothetical protein
MAKETTLKEIGETLASIVEQMATKDDTARLDGKIDKLGLSTHRERDNIKQELKNVGGFGREIDHALERIGAIEKHLGIEKKIVA